ncbi:DUF3253 domain-containing protein [Terriglobus sp. TAA 43]|uniref:DUF3253 domain-containing protein n=1 Tax=Terriglobus sp. TAA 43 TaxID=278961 RepID=UPI0006473710|nr:DUF3253 domain-containing protein [Terriglobus sp. TAA 43]
MKPAQSTIRETILRLLQERGDGKTICPSEVARAIAGDVRRDWEPWMQPVRNTAGVMADEEILQVTQRGHAVNAATAKGPIRLRLR